MPRKKMETRQQSYNLSLSLIDKISIKAQEDNLTNTAVVINALNFYFEQEEVIKHLPELLKAYQLMSKQEQSKKK